MRNPYRKIIDKLGTTEFTDIVKKHNKESNIIWQELPLEERIAIVNRHIKVGTTNA